MLNVDAQRQRYFGDKSNVGLEFYDLCAGVELGGALKNVLAIACGISDGLGFGNNARAALINRCAFMLHTE